MKSLAFASCLFVFISGSLYAQEVSPFSLNVGGGFTEPVGMTGRNLDVGWNIGGGAGFNFGSHLGVMLDVNYNQLGINSGTLYNLGVAGGDIDMFSATIDPVVHLTPHWRFDVYITGGGGLYRQYESFSQYGGNAFGSGPNSFFGGFPGNVPFNQSVVKPGYDAGIGIAMGSKWHGKFYAEARYNHVFLNNGAHTDYLPVTFGFRF